MMACFVSAIREPRPEPLLVVFAMAASEVTELLSFALEGALDCALITCFDGLLASPFHLLHYISNPTAVIR